jgi:putative endonuclease
MPSTFLSTQSHNKGIGFIGEQYAAAYLQKKGFIILDRNVTSRWGEIDIIARSDQTTVFIEVKTRLGTAQGKAYEAFTIGKRRRIQRAIEYYRLRNHLYNAPCRLDLVALQLNPDRSLKALKHYENIDISG